MTDRTLVEAIAYKKRIAELEAELEEMTVALAQAWDQLVPFLQDAPTQATSTLDIVPVLESIIAAIDARMGAVYLKQDDEWFTIPSEIVNVRVFYKHFDQLESGQTIHIHNIPAWHGRPTHWMFMPILINGKTVGAIGVGLEEDERQFTALDARVLTRMTERAASQIVAANLVESQAREAQIAREMQIASLIQRSIQPLTVPHLPALELTAHWQPAATVGGDAWGWVMQPSGQLACFILDVAGKGLPAALGAVSLHTALKMALRLGLNPVDALSTVNNEVYEPYTNAGLLATATVITIDPGSGELEHANAGHTPTLARIGNRWSLWNASTPPLGVLPEITPQSEYRLLESGDLLICYSDGFSEIETQHGFWGTHGLLRAIPDQIAGANLAVQEILAAVEHLPNYGAAADDQTIMGLSFL
ncbi:MAG: SpoIIE family protein phosphatase [Chloroflexi bacterium]|nr:SpoIIE family protein phosphatase [Chloroflexota bacterium]